MTRQPAGFIKIRFLLNFLFCVLPHATCWIPAAICRALYKKLPLAPSIWNGFAGALMANTPPAQLQAILPPTIDVYDEWVSSRGIYPAVDVLEADNATCLLWIGPRAASKVILFFHGGGYVMPLSLGHLDWMEHVRTEAASAGLQLSVCALEYDLIPAHPYPRQMIQGILALKHLLNSGYRPSDIIFGGDSAGGHLALGVLAHLHRPRPTLEMEGQGHIDVQGTIKGCFLVSPLSSFEFNTPSYRRWFSADVLTRRVVDKWGQYLVQDSPWQTEISDGDGWGMALDVRQSWWDNLNAVDFILVTGGYEEVFSDHVQQLGAMLRKRSKGEVTLYMANETHDGPLMDFAAGRPPSATSKAIADFIIACFKV
ncbi:Alpha/Beta hydrolase protein [Aspergillus stella-maris]|uniref:Alpha/Beta hydrolase protein n=1 Tax=Aspergillus stella-maris TaxID=1810926 RepID=UPI003CCD3D95